MKPRESFVFLAYLSLISTYSFLDDILHLLVWLSCCFFQHSWTFKIQFFSSKHVCFKLKHVSNCSRRSGPKSLNSEKSFVKTTNQLGALLINLAREKRTSLHKTRVDKQSGGHTSHISEQTKQKKKTETIFISCITEIKTLQQFSRNYFISNYFFSLPQLESKYGQTGGVSPDILWIVTSCKPIRLREMCYLFLGI